MQVFHTKPVKGGFHVKVCSGFGLAVFLVLFSQNYAYPSHSEASANLCATETVAYNPDVVINDPTKLPPRVSQYFKVQHILPVPRLPGFVHLDGLVDINVSTSLVPMDFPNMQLGFSLGWKLYQYHDRVEAQTGRKPAHLWQHPEFRGVMFMKNVKRALAQVKWLNGLHKTMYPVVLNTKPHKTRDESKPAYEIRFNYEPAVLIQAAAHAERRQQDTVLKKVVTDDEGHAKMTTSTWMDSPELQRGFTQMVRTGNGYTIGVYTTEHHPYASEFGVGKLVGGTLGISSKGSGIFCGVTIFMNRSHPKDKPKHYAFDGAGRLAFFAQLDYLESLGVPWIDSVTVNEIPRDLGGIFVRRSEFLGLIEEASTRPIDFVAPPETPYQIRFGKWEEMLAETKVTLERERLASKAVSPVEVPNP